IPYTPAPRRSVQYCVSAVSRIRDSDDRRVEGTRVPRDAPAHAGGVNHDGVGAASGATVDVDCRAERTTQGGNPEGERVEDLDVGASTGAGVDIQEPRPEVRVGIPDLAAIPEKDLVAGTGLVDGCDTTRIDGGRGRETGMSDLRRRRQRREQRRS